MGPYRANEVPETILKFFSYLLVARYKPQIHTDPRKIMLHSFFLAPYSSNVSITRRQKHILTDSTGAQSGGAQSTSENHFLLVFSGLALQEYTRIDKEYP